MKISKQNFINKWSCWWMLDRQGKQLTKAFEKELDELINTESGEITRDELLKRNFTYRYWHGDEDEVFQEYFLDLDGQGLDFDEIVVDVNKKTVELMSDSVKYYSIPNCKSLSQLDSLIEMFKFAE